MKIIKYNHYSKRKLIGEANHLRYIMRDNQATIIIATGQLQKIIIVSDSQLVINSINGKICMSKEIINVVQDIRMLSYYFKVIRI